MDLESEGKAIDAAALERLHRAKTGALLSALRARRGDPGRRRARSELARLTRYADAIGLAFQVVDDVLDATEDAARLGKTAGKDQAAQKATYVSVHGLERARAARGHAPRGGARRARSRSARAGRCSRLSRAQIVDRHS